MSEVKEIGFVQRVIGVVFFPLFTIIVVALCLGTVGCSKKKTYSELADEAYAIRDSLQKRLNIEKDDFCLKVTKRILKQHFSQIDTVIMNTSSASVHEKGRIDEKTSQLPQFYVHVSTKGMVTGTINGVKGDYSYDTFVNIIREFMNDPYSSDYNLTVNDNNGYYIVSVSDGRKKNVNELNEEIKSNAQFDITVDGIKVRYIGRDGNAVIFSSSKELSPSQMAKVGKKFKYDYSIIEFNVGANYYADYVFATGCVIYKKDGKIVKTDNRKL